MVYQPTVHNLSTCIFDEKGAHTMQLNYGGGLAPAFSTKAHLIASRENRVEWPTGASGNVRVTDTQGPQRHCLAFSISPHQLSTNPPPVKPKHQDPEKPQGRRLRVRQEKPLTRAMTATTHVGGFRWSTSEKMSPDSPTLVQALMDITPTCA